MFEDVTHTMPKLSEVCNLFLQTNDFKDDGQTGIRESAVCMLAKFMTMHECATRVNESFMSVIGAPFIRLPSADVKK